MIADGRLSPGKSNRWLSRMDWFDWLLVGVMLSAALSVLGAARLNPVGRER